MSEDDLVLPVGEIEYELSVWVAANEKVVELVGLTAALPMLGLPDGRRVAPLFTDRDGADEYIEKGDLPDCFALRIDAWDLLAALLRGYQRNGAKLATFDPAPGRKFHYFRIEDLLADIASRDQPGD